MTPIAPPWRMGRSGRTARRAALGLMIALCAAQGEGRSLAASPQPTIGDVVLRSDGTLPGRVFQANRRSAVGRIVEIVRGRRTVALAEIQPDGRFVVGNLAPGLYHIGPAGASTDGVRFYRVWPPGNAPPGASRALHLPQAASPDRAVVRGRPPVLPIVSPKQAVTLGGILAGAVAVPVLHHNIKQDNRIPSSP